MKQQRKVFTLLILAIAAAAVLTDEVSAQAASVTCFVRNCDACNRRNPYLCSRCRAGYALTASSTCNACAPNYEPNTDAQSFTCIPCEPGFTSPGGLAPCTPVTPSAGRRLFFDAEGDPWV